MFLASFMTVLLITYYSCDQNQKNEMGGACGTYGGEEMYTEFR